MIRLINQTRKANGVSELPVNEALMNAAQACSNQRFTWHHAPEESKAAADAGYPYGFSDNLSVFTGTADAAQHAVDNWINSVSHLEMVWRLTPSFSATASWDRPFFFRASDRLLPKLIL